MFFSEHSVVLCRGRDAAMNEWLIPMDELSTMNLASRKTSKRLESSEGV